MDLNFLRNLIIPIVLVICLVVGYILKKWVHDLDNKYIPTIEAILGAVLGCIAMKGISIEIIASGALTGLASTGLHQLFTQYIEKAEWDQVTPEAFEELSNGEGTEEKTTDVEEETTEE